MIYLKTLSLLLLSLLFIPGNEIQEKKPSAPDMDSVRNISGKEIDTEKLEEFLAQKMVDWKIAGLSLALINDQALAYHTTKGYANKEEQIPVTEKTLFEGASMSKPIFANMIMFLVEEGKLDLDKPLYQYYEYPDLAHDERYKKITARMVLSHQSGLPNWRSGDTLKIGFEPGSNYEYSGEGYQFLAKVVEKILDTDYKGLEAFYQEKIAGPAGMKVSKFIQNEENLKNKAIGYREGEKVTRDPWREEFGAAYAIHSEAKDFSKWMIQLLKAETLSPQSYETLFNVEYEMPADSPNRAVGIVAWTLGFTKAQIGPFELYGHGGNNQGFSSLFIISRDNNWGMVLFTNADQVTEFGLELLTYLNQ